MSEKKTGILRIRCSEKSFVRFKRYAAAFKDYEEALNNLLEVAGEPKILSPYWIDWPRVKPPKKEQG